MSFPEGHGIYQMHSLVKRGPREDVFGFRKAAWPSRRLSFHHDHQQLLLPDICRALQ